MTATATQKKEPVKQTAGQTSQKQPEKETKIVPHTLGIAVMVVLLVLSLVVGNFRALQNATPSSFLKQGDVATIIDQRSASASNVAKVLEQIGTSKTELDAIRSKADELKKAKTARSISIVNQELQAVVSDAVGAATGGTSENQRMLSRAADNFTEEGNFLTQEGMQYNEKAEKARKVYDGLLMKFMLPQPDVYEGL